GARAHARRRGGRAPCDRPARCGPGRSARGRRRLPEQAGPASPAPAHARRRRRRTEGSAVVATILVFVGLPRSQPLEEMLDEPGPEVGISHGFVLETRVAYGPVPTPVRSARTQIR